VPKGIRPEGLNVNASGSKTMKIMKQESLAIPDVKVVRFARFPDSRGYFTEPYRKSDFLTQLSFMKGVEFYQCNESYSRPNVVRGLHFQWNPFMGKLVRTIQGRMIDLFLDIRKGSPTYGKAAAYEISSTPDKDYADWIWVPPGFAHGNFFTEATTIEYFCSGEYSPGCEAGISPLSSDIDWSLCDHALKAEMDLVLSKNPAITDKDKNGLSLAAWTADDRSSQFLYDELRGQ
jgi:dTDP-4-dehydrorhamnose 3,5-epimerase